MPAGSAGQDRRPRRPRVLPQALPRARRASRLRLLRRLAVRPAPLQRAGEDPGALRDGARGGLPARLRPLRGPRAAHLPRPRGADLVLQPELPDVLRVERPGRDTPDAGGGPAFDRPAGRGGGTAGGPSAQRRRADHPPRVRGHPPLRRGGADRRGDGQHERHHHRPRRRAALALGRAPDAHRGLPAARRLRRRGQSGVARRQSHRAQAEGRGAARREADPYDAGQHAAAGRERPRHRPARPLRRGAAVGHGHLLSARDVLGPPRDARGSGAADHLPGRGAGHRGADRRPLSGRRLHAASLRAPELPHADLRLPARRDRPPALALHGRARAPRISWPTASR